MICLDCRYIRERPSGIGVVVQELIRRLPALVGNEPLLLLKHPQAPGALSNAPNVREQIVEQEANGPATMWWLPRVVDLRGVDLYYSPSNILPAGLSMATVVTVCDVMWLKHPQWARTQGGWGRIETAYYQHGIRRALERATRICTISQATKDEIGTVDEQAKQRTTVIHEGVSDDFHPIRTEQERAQVEQVKQRCVPGVQRYVLTVGQFAPYKNHERIVRAFARAFPGDSSIHLVLVQRLGPGSRALGPIASMLGIQQRVHFLQGLSLDDLAALYRGAACVCHPSLYEGFGNALAEGMASGVPVVTSNRSSMPEVCADAGLYVDPEDIDDIARGLRTVLTQESVAAGMRERGVSRARSLRWDAYAEHYARVFREVLADRRSGRSRLTSTCGSS